jgi:hypothetical protein
MDIAGSALDMDTIENVIPTLNFPPIAEKWNENIEPYHPDESGPGPVCIYLHSKKAGASIRHRSMTRSWPCPQSLI